MDAIDVATDVLNNISVIALDHLEKAYAVGGFVIGKKIYMYA
jgi:hypothetical protein